MTSYHMWNDIAATCGCDFINDVRPCVGIYKEWLAAFTHSHSHSVHSTPCLKHFPILKSSLSWLSLTLACLSPKSLLQLVSVLVQSQTYVLTTVPTSQSLLVVILPS